MEHLTAIVNKKAKKWITTASIVLFGAISIVFTILCMRYFKSGVLYKYNTVITSSLVAAEVICTGLCFAFFLTNKEAVYKLLLTALGLAAVFLLGVYILQVTGVLDKIDSVDDLRLWIEQTGVWAPICFIVIQFLQVVVLPIPSVVTVGAARMYHLQLYRHRSRLAGRFLYRQSSRLSRRRMARGKRDARFVAFEDQG